MAAALLATPLPADRGLSAATGNGDPLAAIARRAPHLSAGEVRLLAHAMANGTAVRIRYTNARGVTSARVIDPLDLDGHLLEAWCHLRDDERMFSLDRIDEVSPV
jgi:predicted DNA-binding transcriptional regulator YafY